MTPPNAELGSRVSKAVRVVYLGGLGRSGSTLFERLLGELPGVCPAGEVVHMWQRGVAENERCGCGEAFGACDFWIKVGKAAFGGWENVSTDRIIGLRATVDRTRRIPLLARRSLPARLQAAVTDYTGYYLSVYRAIADVSGCQTVVDSSKHASLAFCLARREEIGLRVIHLVRDSRAVAYSWTTKVARPDGDTGNYMTTYRPARAAAQWNAQNGALQLLARRGTEVLRLRYEDFVAAPEQAVRQAATFAGLAAGDLPLGVLGSDDESRCALLSKAHTASGNPLRFVTGKVPIRSDDRWRASMPGAERRTVTALTLPLLSHYGYIGRAT